MATKITAGATHEQSVSCNACGWGDGSGDFDEGWAFTVAAQRSQTARARRHAETTGHTVTILRTYAARVRRA
jgi:hypothetical protein